MYIVSDATVGSIDGKGCVIGQPPVVKGDELDAISLRGGCIAVAGKSAEIRCSSGAVQIFGRSGDRPDKENPALLYVLAHELGHILQRRAGEYAGRVDPIDLKASPESKQKTLRESCEPGQTRAEEDADRLAVQVLVKLLPEAPYRESQLSSQGSMLWAVDQLNLAANTWRSVALEREFMSQVKPHKSFVPTKLPTSRETVDVNARRFVCDVLTKKSGVVLYPGKSTSHPSLEVRIQRVAEALRSVAAGLPKTGAQQENKPVAVLQEQLSDIFTFMYRETGVYLQAVQSAICTRVNSDKPTAGCTPGR